MPDQCSQAVAPITPEQVWAARGLLRWSRERLSSESDVPYGFIVKFERLGHIAPVFSRQRGFDGLSAIRQAFERRGVTFTGRMGAFMRAVAFIAALLFATGTAEAREPAARLSVRVLSLDGWTAGSQASTGHQPGLRYLKEGGRVMPYDSGKLTAADIPIINDFMRRASPDNCLTCPVTGGRVPIEQWQISDRLCMLPVSGQHFQADLTSTSPMLSCRSPAGGFVFLDAIYMGLLKRAAVQ